MPYSQIIAIKILFSYLLGSLPIGLWIVAAMKGIDIRTCGSGNIGATNVWRVCGPVAGTIVFTLDVLKGMLPPLILGAGLSSIWKVAFAMAAMGGHVFSVFLKFRGGKGIATGLGALLGVAPIAGLVGFSMWILLVLTTRYVSIASLSAGLSLSGLVPYFYPGDKPRLTLGIACSCVTLLTHRANIRRLLNGTEPRVGQKKPPAPPVDADHE